MSVFAAIDADIFTGTERAPIDLEAREGISEERLEAFMSRVERSPDCWTWVGGRQRETGYGRFSDQGFTWLAHRWIYQALVAEIPEGLFIDHLCRNRSCVNPAHLEPVTPRENARRRAWTPSNKTATCRVCGQTMPDVAS